MSYTEGMLLLHVLTALTSVGFTIYLYVSPSRARLRVSYGLLAGVIGTGTLLIVRSHAPMLQSCMTGMAFVGISLVGIVLATRKLAKAETQNA
jgi:hypothetical protein